MIRDAFVVPTKPGASVVLTKPGASVVPTKPDASVEPTKPDAFVEPKKPDAFVVLTKASIERIVVVSYNNHTYEREKVACKNRYMNTNKILCIPPRLPNFRILTKFSSDCVEPLPN